MRDFKFLQKNNRPYKNWLLNINLQGQLQWILEPVGVIYYMDRRWDGSFYTEELKTMTVTITNRYINSYNHFMEMNRNYIIFVYEFVDNTNISNMIHYNEDNFDEMPKDRPLIFRGVIRNNETI
jgi:hypothetical protein